MRPIILLIENYNKLNNTFNAIRMFSLTKNLQGPPFGRDPFKNESSVLHKNCTIFNTYSVSNLQKDMLDKYICLILSNLELYPPLPPKGRGRPKGLPLGGGTKIELIGSTERISIIMKSYIDAKLRGFKFNYTLKTSLPITEGKSFHDLFSLFYKHNPRLQLQLSKYNCGRIRNYNCYNTSRGSEYSQSSRFLYKIKKIGGFQPLWYKKLFMPNLKLNSNKININSYYTRGLMLYKYMVNEFTILKKKKISKNLTTLIKHEKPICRLIKNENSYLPIFYKERHTYWESKMNHPYINTISYKSIFKKYLENNRDLEGKSMIRFKPVKVREMESLTIYSGDIFELSRLRYVDRYVGYRFIYYSYCDELRQTEFLLKKIKKMFK